MQFKITSQTRDNQILTHFYDNITQEIWDESKNFIDLKNDPRCKEMLWNYRSTAEPAIIKKDVNVLRIQLGLNCNFSCKYCNQRFESALDKKAKTIKLPDSVRVRNFIKLLKEKEITTKEIVLWGGEPFVYFKLLKILIPKLRELYPEVRIATVTNGSLLNEEIINFCIEHRISLTMSHDAQSFSVYRNDKNPLDNPKILQNVERYLKAANESKEFGFSINVVVTPENCDLLKIDDYFTSKFGYRVNWHFESIAKLDQDSLKIISSFTEEYKKKLLNSIFVLGTQDPQMAISNLRQKVSDILSYIINRHSAKDKRYPCDVMTDYVLTTTLDGELLACHGASKQHFTFGKLADIGSVKNDLVYGWDQRNQCAECPVVTFCSGVCSIYSNEDVDAACENMKLWNLGLFACAWYILFNSVIQKIEPVSE